MQPEGNPWAMLRLRSLGLVRERAVKSRKCVGSAESSILRITYLGARAFNLIHARSCASSVDFASQVKVTRTALAAARLNRAAARK